MPTRKRAPLSRARIPATTGTVVEVPLGGCIVLCCRRLLRSCSRDLVLVEEGLLGRQAVSRYIRETSPTEVCVVFIAILGFLVDMEPEAFLNGLLLIPRATEVITEASKASRPIVPRDFRRDSLGAAN